MPIKTNKLRSIFNKLAIATFVLVTNVHAQDVIDRVIAVVGDEPILLSSFEESRMQAYNQGLPKDQKTNDLVLEQLLLEKLLLHQAEIDSIEVTEQQVNMELNQRIQYFASQMPNGIEDLEKFYGKSVQQIRKEFYTEIENRMKTEQMRSKVISDVKVSPKEIKSYYNSFHRDSVPLVGSEIQYAQITKKPAITDDEKMVLKKELEDLRQDILNNLISFEDAARQYSCDEGSAQKYGDFGWVGRGEFVPQFERTAFSTPIDTISQVFETQYGYHILVIEKRRGEQYKGKHILFCFKPSPKELYKSKKALIEVRDQIKSGEISWNDAVKEHSDDDDTKGANGVVYNVQSGTSFWAMENLDPITFRAIDNLEIDEISNPYEFETFDGRSYKIVKLLGQTKPHRANLNDDYQLIQKMAEFDAQEKKITEWVNSKITGVYIKVDEKYHSNDFAYNWIPKM